MQRQTAGSLVQPISAGVLAAIVGFASTFAVVLQGLRAAGATPAQAASGLLALCLMQGVLGISLSLRWRQPISIVWSTSGVALLIGTGAPAGGFPVAVGAFIVAGALVVAAGAWGRFARVVTAMPISLASAMLAGILMELCVAPVRAVAALPTLALPIVLAWALAWQFARAYAVPIAVLVTAIMVGFATHIPTETLANSLPRPEFVAPVFRLLPMISIGVPIFIVTMASQNLPGLAVLRGNGYHVRVGPIFMLTGVGSMLAALFGSHAVNLSAITASLCAGPDAHPDPAKRYIASVVSAITYIVLGLCAGFAASFVAASPPLLIEAVAGLALLNSLGGALVSALGNEKERIPALITFVVTASGASFFGIGAAFWGLLAGGALLASGSLRSKFRRQ
jgi:benzoate membrane transport protein